MAVGTLGLVGGAEWNPECNFDRYFLEKSGALEVTLLPTAAAYERPQASVDFATRWFASLGAQVNPLMILTRADADNADFARHLQSSSFIYLGGGSPMHLFSVLKETLCFEAIISAFKNGAVLAGSSAGAMVLGDPMVDPRGGGLTLGLGLVRDLAVIPHYASTSPELKHRTQSLAEPEVIIAGIDEQTALIRDPEGSWIQMGEGGVHLIQGESLIELSRLEGLVQLNL